VDNLAISTQFC